MAKLTAKQKIALLTIVRNQSLNGGGSLGTDAEFPPPGHVYYRQTTNGDLRVTTGGDGRVTGNSAQ